MLTVIIYSLLFFNLFYLAARLKKDFSVIDVAWGPSFFLIYCTSFVINEYPTNLRTLIIGALVLIWSARLSFYIYTRSAKIKQEDYRYAQWRKEWGDKANLIAYFKVFMLQAVLSLIVASPLFLIQTTPHQNEFGTLLDYIGIAAWIIGFAFEVISDNQKSKFKADPSNKGVIMQTGLWKYSRHPNYFGEVLLWWGIFIIVLNEVPFYYAAIGPALLHFLIIKVSGVALSEKMYENNLQFQKYKETTNSFIPWFPKK
jgi:steroid 5-alpha reductase family enzyme